MSTDNNQPQTEDKTILVAEDIQSNFLLVKALLRNRYRLLHAGNGREALDILHRDAVDLVLMDMKMPVLGGFETTVKIREFNTGIPVIALTAYAFDSDREAAMAAGFNDYLVKPLDKESLLATIEKYIGPWAGTDE